ncbi:MAG: hypothetical protein ACYCVU_10415, partial [Gammaproteobacteria bacterium]
LVQGIERQVGNALEHRHEAALDLAPDHLALAVRVGRELQLIPNLKRRSPSRSHTPSTPGAERSPYS